MKLIKGLLIAILAIATTACEDMLDNIRPYLDKGETVYVGKPDFLYTRVGNKRIELSVFLRSGFTHKKCLVVVTDLDGKKDSVYHAVERENGEQELKYMFNDLKEGQYDFNVVMFDALGNKSLGVSTKSYSLGSFYEQTLINRSITLIEANKSKGFVITWKKLNEEGAISTEVTYTTKDGPKTITVPLDENSTMLTGCIQGSKLTWKTSYKPMEDALDVFYSATSEKNTPDNFVVQLDKSKFKEVRLPTDAYMGEWGFSMSRIWNGDSNWGSNDMCHSVSSAGWPQWFTFDLGVLTKLDRYRYWQRLQEGALYDRGSNPRKWELYGRPDTPPADGSWDGWIKLMDCESIKPSGVFDRSLTTEDIDAAKAGELFTFPKNTPEIRYIRWKTTTSFNGAKEVHFQEVTFWGEDLSD